MTSEKSLYKTNWILHVLLIPVLVAMGLWLTQKYSIAVTFGILIFLLTSSWLISRFELQYHLLMLLAVLMPFSIEVSLTESLNLNFPSEPLLAVAAFSIGWDIFRKHGMLRQFFGGETIWILPFLISYIITSFFSTILWVSIKFAIVNITYILVFYVWQKMLFKSQPQMFPKLIGLYSISLFAILLFSIFQFGQFDWNPVTIRGIFKPFYKDNTIFGATAALVASFWIAYSLKEKSVPPKIFWLFCGFIFLVGVVLSNSRAAALSTIAFGIIWIILLLRVRLMQIVVAAILVLLIAGIFRSSLYDALSENKNKSHDSQASYVEQLKSSGNISSDISNIERMNRWVAGIGMFAEKPYTGFGPGTYQFAYIPYQKEEFKNRLTVKNPWHVPPNSGGTAHSEYILAISEMGVFGILTLLILIGRWIWIAFVKSRRHSRRASIIMAFAVLCTYLFHAAFNNFLTTDKFAFLFWGTAAWMVAHSELENDEQPGVL